MVHYQNLFLPDCAYKSLQYPDFIKYILKIEANRPDPGGTLQLRDYDHLYYVSCEYDNQNRSTASFIPRVNRNDNDTGMEIEIAISFAPFKGKQLLHIWTLSYLIKCESPSVLIWNKIYLDILIF